MNIILGRSQSPSFSIPIENFSRAMKLRGKIVLAVFTVFCTLALLIYIFKDNCFSAKKLPEEKSKEHPKKVSLPASHSETEKTKNSINEIIFPNGDKYVGPVVGGKLHGKGTLICNNGDKYEGEFINGIPGKGILIYSNGDVYEGGLVNGKRNGKGKYTSVEGIYDGDFVDDKKEGQGTFTWYNGNKYVGDFFNGFQHGKGVYIFPNGDKVEGNYVNGELKGRAKFTSADGKKFERIL